MEVDRSAGVVDFIVAGVCQPRVVCFSAWFCRLADFKDQGSRPGVKFIREFGAPSLCVGDTTNMSFETSASIHA